MLIVIIQECRRPAVQHLRKKGQVLLTIANKLADRKLLATNAQHGERLRLLEHRRHAQNNNSEMSQNLLFSGKL